MMEESTSFDFDPKRLSRLVKTRRAQSVEFELERYKHWGVIRSNGDDLAPMSLKVDESACTSSLTSNTDHEDLRAALGTLRRVHGRARHCSSQIKQSEDVESSTVTATRALRPLGTPIPPVVSLRKTSDRRTLEAMAQVSKRLPLDTSFSQQAPVQGYHHLQRAESKWDASCLIYYGSLIEGTFIEPNVDAVTAASSVSTVEHQCQKETPAKTKDLPFLLLLVLILVSSWHIVSTNVFIEAMRQSLKQHPTAISLDRTLRTTQHQVSSARERQTLYSDETNSWLGDTLNPLIQAIHKVLGRVDDFQPTALLDDVGVPDKGPRCEERLHGVRHGMVEADNTRYTEVGDRSSSLRWIPDAIPDVASESRVLQDSSIHAVFEDPMLFKLLKLELATRKATKLECSLMAIFLEKYLLFEFHEMCPTVTRWAEGADEMSMVTSLPVVRSTTIQLAHGPQRAMLKQFVGFVWMNLRQRIKVWTPFRIEVGQWKARAGGLLRKPGSLFRSIVILPERKRYAAFRFIHDFRDHIHADIMESLRKLIMKLHATFENGYRSKI